MKLDWRHKVLIGQGGNSKVYKVKSVDGHSYAVKVLKERARKKAYKRFKDEIDILTKLAEVQGVINVLDSFLPERHTKENQAYYVMPLATPLEDYLKLKTYTQFYAIILKLIDTLVEMHERNYTHRDIKPENLLVINDQPVFSDFGLAHFPKKEKVSHPTEKIGAVWTIAPEMKRISSTAQYKKADVYSFAKTLWILITKEKRGFEGQYVVKSSISLDNFVDLHVNGHYSTYGEWAYQSFVLLERLLIDSTDNNPEKRPEAREFAERLREWYNTSAALLKRNKYEWEHCLNRIFPISIPITCSWTSLCEIERVLQLLAKEYDQLNYSFFPEFGGTEITSINLVKENGFLMLNDYYIMKPSQLYFESMDNLDFSYFYLQLDIVTSIGSKNSFEFRELLYLNDEGIYFQDKVEKSKEVQRYLKGSIIITRKTSILNIIRGELDGHFGLHSNRTRQEYRNLIEDLTFVYKDQFPEDAFYQNQLAV